jgi:hypothetical protein
MFRLIPRATVLALAAILSLAAFPAAAEMVNFTVAVDGEQQVPPAATAGVGVLEATFDTETRVLTWTLLYSGLTGPATAGHFHGPADIDVNAGVAVGFEGSLASPLVGTATLLPEQAKQLLDGLWYINIHTAAFPGGEIRGQLVRNPPAARAPAP